MKSYCYHCMKAFENGTFCPLCGSDLRRRLDDVPYHLPAGTILADRYLIGEVLGEGGFGITYIGLDKGLSKRVAVKEFFPLGTVNRNAADSEKVIVTRSNEESFGKGVIRFLEEAQSVAAFSNEDGIVDVLDYFQENNTAYIVMEYLDGQTLQTTIERQGTFSFDRILSLMTPVMKSLNAMHRQGVIHRDLSPDNIMYTKNGVLKVMDFGSARYYLNKERSMSVVLKQGYAPEEQYRRNGQQDPYTDVYALCATIYTCVTGRVPDDSLDRMVNDTLLPPSRLGVIISPAQEDALMHGLAVRARDRCPDMNTLLAEMTGSSHRRTTERHTVNAEAYYPQPSYRPEPAFTPPPPKRQTNAPLVAAIALTAVAIIAVSAVLIVLLLKNDSNPVTPAASTAAATTFNGIVEATTTEGGEVTPTVKPSTEQVPTTEEPVPTITEYDSPKSSGTKYTHEYINSITKRIHDDFTKFVKSDYRTGQQKIGVYAVYQLRENNHLWIATPNDTMRDEYEGGAYQVKDWYFYDSNGSVYFVLRYDGTEFYRYYLDNGNIVRYTVGSHYDGNQISYDYGDSHIPDPSEILRQSTNAYGNVAYRL